MFVVHDHIRQLLRTRTSELLKSGHSSPALSRASWIRDAVDARGSRPGISASVDHSSPPRSQTSHSLVAPQLAAPGRHLVLTRPFLIVILARLGASYPFSGSVMVVSTSTGSNWGRTPSYRLQSPRNRGRRIHARNSGPY